MDSNFRGSRLFGVTGLLLGIMVIFAGAPAVGTGLPLDLRFEKLSIEHGLSQASVLCILQDSQGFMWFGTYNGLNRYDGLNMVVFTNHLKDPASLSDSGIRHLCEDSYGRLWVATSNGGLNMYDRARSAFHDFKHNPFIPDSISSNEVRVIFEDSRRNLWVGTSNGLNRFNRDTETFSHYRDKAEGRQGLFGVNIRTIIESPDGRLFLGTEQGMLIFDVLTGQVMDMGSQPDFQNLKGKAVNALLFEDQVLWIGLDTGGLYRLDLESGQWDHPLQSGTVYCLYRDSRGILWVGSKRGLGRRLESPKAIAGRLGRDYYFYRHNPEDSSSLSHDEVHAIMEDRAGILWIGTYSDGVSKLNPIRQAFAIIRHEPWNPSSLSGNHVVSIFEDRQEYLWVGTYDNGLNRLDRKTGKCITYATDVFQNGQQASGSIQAILEDREGALWIGTQRAGLWKLDNLTGSFMKYTHDPKDPYSLSMDNVYFLFEDNDGYIWVGTSRRGLNRLDKKTGRFKQFVYDSDHDDSLSNNRVRHIFQCRQGYLWIGTNQGLNRFDRETETFRHWEHDDQNPVSISHNRVTPILEDQDGALWIGTDMGLNRFNPYTETFSRFTVDNGFENDTIQGMLMDEQGRLWMSTYKGITRFDPRTGDIRNYNMEDGLQCAEFWMNSCYRNKTGEMFFGGLKGLNHFFPGDITPNHHLPPVVITDFKVMNKPYQVPQPISPEDPIHLSYRDLFFSFEFAVLDFYNPNKNICAYKLEGFDQDWIQVGRARSATYTNLDQGRFIFRVRGANNDGLWNEDGVAVNIVISPPFWKTWWFRTLGVLFILMMIFGYLSYRTRNLRAQAERLDRQVRARTEELEEEIGVRKQLEVDREKVIDELKAALNEVKTLQGIIPICANCKKIRDDAGYWKRVEEYLQDHTDVRFTHGICPECKEKLYPELRSKKPKF